MSVAAYPLAHGHQHRPAGSPDHRVHFPVPDPRACIDDCRTLVDHHLIGESAAPLAPRSPFAVRLETVAQVEVEATTRCLVPIDMLVEGLVAERTVPFKSDPGADLLGAPLILAQLDCRKIQQRGVAALPAVGLAPRVTLRLHETIIPASTKATQLAADCRGVLADRLGDLNLWRTIEAHGFDSVALLTGQPAVGRHGGLVWSLNRDPPTAALPSPESIWASANPAKAGKAQTKERSV